MAQRFGGRHSPNGHQGAAAAGDAQGPGQTGAGGRWRNRRARNINLAARAMYFVPLPLLFAGIGEVRQGDAVGMLVELGAFATLILGAGLLNEGLKAEIAYNDRKIARPPAIPRKAFAAICAALGVGLASWLGAGNGMFAGLAFGAVAGVAHLFAFGLDPLKRKGMEGVSEFEADRVARAIDAAEATVSEIMAGAKQIGDRQIEERVERMLGSVREVFRAVEDDPRDLTRARKFLGVYLVGARDATIKFGALYSKRRDPQARADYVALLEDLEASFRNHRQDLLEDTRTDLDVEIEVLRERLQREGV